MPVSYQRKLPTTGYSIFICNTSLWFADQFLRSGRTHLYYKISDHHRYDFGRGQLGVLRLNDDSRPARLRNGNPKLQKGIYAFMEVNGAGQHIPDPDTLGYADPADAAEPKWRVPVTIIENLVDRPLLDAEIPADDEKFQYLHRALRTATIPIGREAVEFIVDMAGGIAEPQEIASLSPDDVAKIQEFEDLNAGRTPIITETHSRRIERGSIGRWVKRQQGYRCQICSVLGCFPIAFEDRNGVGFAEAHHVIPVSEGRAGSLSHLNIMVLCPNHHRQAHHGRFEINRDEPDHWQITLDGNSIRIDKPPPPV
jgi:hypothetical protein